MSVKLTDAHLVMLSAAAQRKDRCLTAPDKMKGAILAKVSAKLVKVGLVREVQATAGAPVWRRDSAGRSYALKLTAAGLKAIAVDEGLDEAIASKEAQQPQSHPVGASASADPEDAGEVAATVTPRAVTGLRKRGYAVVRERGDTQNSVYRIASRSSGSEGRFVVPTEASESHDRELKPKAKRAA